MAVEPIPFVDLQAQFRSIEGEVRQAIDEVLSSAAFIQGPFAKRFEQAFAEMSGFRHAIGCANGTAALSIALRAFGIGPGDEVITVAHTFIATVEAIIEVGATPVLVDIDPASYLIDPAAVEAAIGPRTRAIMPVHIYGTPADMTRLGAIAKRHGLVLIEDAAQAHLARFDDKPIGTVGDAVCFSFYPGKNLGAFGDAGLVACTDDSKAAWIRRYIDHGRTGKYEHTEIGTNLRLDGVQAAILSAKLGHLPDWTAARRRIAALYRRHLAAAGFAVMAEPRGAESVYHLFVVEVSNRAAVQEAMSQRGIATGVHYPIPLHLQPALSHLGCKPGQLPHTERTAERILSLPICGSISEASAMRVVEAFLEVARP